MGDSYKRLGDSICSPPPSSPRKTWCRSLIDYVVLVKPLIVTSYGNRDAICDMRSLSADGAASSATTRTVADSFGLIRKETKQQPIVCAARPRDKWKLPNEWAVSSLRRHIGAVSCFVFRWVAQDFCPASHRTTLAVLRLRPIAVHCINVFICLVSLFSIPPLCLESRKWVTCNIAARHSKFYIFFSIRCGCLWRQLW